MDKPLTLSVPPFLLCEMGVMKTIRSDQLMGRGCLQYCVQKDSEVVFALSRRLSGSRLADERRVAHVSCIRHPWTSWAWRALMAVDAKT